MRQQLQLLLLIALVVVLGVAGYRILFGEAPGQELVVVSATRATAINSDASVEQLVAGSVLEVDASVETGVDGEAVLQYGDKAELKLSELTTVQVVSADATGLRVELEAGAVSARVRQGATPLNISNRGRAVGATNADFTVMVGRNGPLSLASQRGNLRLSGMAGQTELRAGGSVHAELGGTVSLMPINENLLLDVEWPEATKTREAEIEVTGTTDPYATVTLGEGPEAVRVRADRDGRFRATVPLAEGVNDIELKVRDVSGREARRQQALNRDSTAPVIEAAEILWGQ
jgi:hypothetical protein